MGQRKDLLTFQGPAEKKESLCTAYLCKNHPAKNKPLTGLPHSFSHAFIPQMLSSERLVGTRQHVKS